MRIVKLLIAMILTTGILFACDTGDSEQETAQTEQAEVQVEIIISQEHGEEVLEEEAFNVEEGTNLMEVLKNNFDIEDEGGFINSINGVKAEAGEPYFWSIQINGEDAVVGAEDYIIEDGDQIELDFHSWE